MWAGSASLVQELIQHGLVDEYRMMVFPIILGSGKRLFGPLNDAAALVFGGARTVGDDGVVILTYHPRPDAPGDQMD